MKDAELIEGIGRLSGLHVSLANVPALKEHVGERMRVRHLEHLREFFASLEPGHPERADELRRLATLLTTHETFFMRDTSQMALLRSRILPGLIAERRERGEQILRLWSCACSSGEEPASLAILLRELLPDLSQWKIEIHATDVSEEILNRARRATYGDWSFRGCDATFRFAHFRPRGDRWVLLPEIRHMIRYHRFDLLQDPLPDSGKGLSQLDLILCRNVFIYFEPGAIAATAEKLAASLRTGGVLMTAHGELRQQRPGHLVAEIHPESVIYRKAAPEAGSKPAMGSSPPAKTPARRTHGQVPPPTPHPRPFPARVRPPAVAGAQARPRLATRPAAVPIDPALENAWRLADAGQHEAAQAACDRILAADRMCAGAHFLGAVLASETGDVNHARVALRRTLYLDPGMIAAHMQLAGLSRAHAKIQSADKTRETIRKLAASMPADALIPYMGDLTAGELAAQLADEASAMPGGAD